MVIKMLHNNAHEYDLGDGTTVDEMIEAFKSGDVNGEDLGDNTKVLPRRNYSTLEVVRDDTEYGAFALNAFIVAESVERVTDAKPYPIKIEPLL